MSELTVYATSWCPYCAILRADLDEEGVEYTEIDVDRDPEAADVVRQLNNGNRTVPTVVFPDGSALTNPPISKVLDRLKI